MLRIGWHSIRHEFRTVINDGKKRVEKKIRMVMRCQVIHVRKTFIKHFYKGVWQGPYKLIMKIRNNILILINIY